MQESDRDYFGRRAAEERAAADRAADPLAQRCHSELAARYEEAASAYLDIRTDPGSFGLM